MGFLKLPFLGCMSLGENSNKSLGGGNVIFTCFYFISRQATKIHTFSTRVRSFDFTSPQVLNFGNLALMFVKTKGYNE